ncbi:hypothetical protein Acsp02_67220 [Actinoplanes sp. NBRC 103695]|nr:CPBP family intramembrane glutamic endopeptidase [Actinoplanes sp. NBRC 103695]GLY99469.1 hypothetical protein Acsp02_67220 [Actinoplanes sp. NBRC 103695]
MSSIEYHRLARTGAHRWWRPVAGTAFILAAAVVGMTGLYGGASILASILGSPEDADGLPTFGPLADLALAFLGIALLLPPILLAARWIQRRPAGTLSSVTGRLRWRLLRRCLPVAAVAVVVVLAGGTALGAVTGMDAGFGDAPVAFAAIATSMAVLLLVVPLQAAAEEYLTRGWLLQAVGTWFRRPWVPIGVQAVVFAALHGWGTPWGFADLVVFGLVAGWLTVRTGGLEAAIALHVMNNVIGAGLAAYYGDLSMDETAADMPWQLAVVDFGVLLAYAWIVVLIVRRQDAPLPSDRDGLDHDVRRLDRRGGDPAQTGPAQQGVELGQAALPAAGGGEHPQIHQRSDAGGPVVHDDLGDDHPAARVQGVPAVRQDPQAVLVLPVVQDVLQQQ